MVEGILSGVRHLLTGGVPRWYDETWWVPAVRTRSGCPLFQRVDSLRFVSPPPEIHRVTYETTDPDELRRRVGEVAQEVEG